jgi:hypothetical protein
VKGVAWRSEERHSGEQIHGRWEYIYTSKECLRSGYQLRKYLGMIKNGDELYNGEKARYQQKELKLRVL